MPSAHGTPGPIGDLLSHLPCKPLVLADVTLPKGQRAGERTVAQRLSKIPDGRWSHRLYAAAARTR